METKLIDVVVDVPPPTLTQPLAIPADQPKSILEQFGEMFAQAEVWRQKAHAIRVTDPSQKEAIKLARESRLALRRIRCDVENRRKELKEEALRTSQTIDGIARVFRGLVEPIEEYLEKQETFPERFEAAQIEARRVDRTELLGRLGYDHSQLDLGRMTPEQFDAVLGIATTMKAAREEAARKAEEDRIRKEREAEEERIRREEEFRKAKAEAEAARRAQAEAEEARKAAEAKAAEAARVAKAEADRREAQLKAEREAAEAKLRAEAEAKAAEERRKREAAEAEAARLRKAEEDRLRMEREAAAKEAARIEAAARAGDREKLQEFAKLIRDSVMSSVPTVKSKDAKARLSAAVAAIEEAIGFLN